MVNVGVAQDSATVLLHLSSCFVSLDEGSTYFSVKSQRVNLLGFVEHIFLVAITEFCHSKVKAATENTAMTIGKLIRVVVFQKDCRYKTSQQVGFDPRNLPIPGLDHLSHICSFHCFLETNQKIISTYGLP